MNGKNGSIGLNGTNGQNGLSVRGEKGNEGKPGVEGTTIVKRIVVTDSDEQNPHSAATLDDGLKFEGDGGKAVVKKLNESMKISCGVTEKAKLTDDNIGIIAENGQLNVKLSKTLTGLTSVSSDKFVSGNTNVDMNGITIGKDTDVNKNVSLTKDGLNMGGKKINNFESGKVEKGNTEAVTGGAVSKTLEKVKTEGSKALEKYKTSNDIAVK